MTKEQLQGTKIRVTPEQSERVQKYAFERGFMWQNQQVPEVAQTDMEYLFLTSAKLIAWDFEAKWNKSTFTEIFFSDLFPDEVKEPVAALTWAEVRENFKKLATDYWSTEMLDEFIEYLKQNFHAPIPKDKPLPKPPSK